MMIEYHGLKIEEKLWTNILHVRITGKFEKEDYDIFVPVVENMIAQHGRIRILLELRDFKGWTAGAAWEDTKFGIKHFNDIEKLAILGDRKWENGMELFCKVFTTAKVKLFTPEESADAEKWLLEDNAK